MSSTVSIKDKLLSKLNQKGTLTSEDFSADAAVTRPEPAAGMVDEDGDSVVEVPADAMEPVVEFAGKAGMGQLGRAAVDKADIPRDPLTAATGEPVTVTAADKENFLQSMVSGTRFTRPFSVLGGRITGEFRCRTAGETRAIVDELDRQAQLRRDSVFNHVLKMRYALIHCQLSELNGVTRPEWKEPLRSVETVASKDGVASVEASTPVWYEEMQLIFDKRMDGMVDLLFAELGVFEKVYWALVQNVTVSSFWVPEDSIIA